MIDDPAALTSYRHAAEFVPDAWTDGRLRTEIRLPFDERKTRQLAGENVSNLLRPNIPEAQGTASAASTVFLRHLGWLQALLVILVSHRTWVRVMSAVLTLGDGGLGRQPGAMANLKLRFHLGPLNRADHTCKGDRRSDARRLQPPGGYQALIGPQFRSGDRNRLSAHYVLASYSRGTGPLVGASRGGGIRGTGVAVAGGARSDEQLLDEAWCSSLSHRQSNCAGDPVLRDCYAGGALDAGAREGSTATAP